MRIEISNPPKKKEIDNTERENWKEERKDKEERIKEIEKANSVLRHE